MRRFKLVWLRVNIIIPLWFCIPAQLWDCESFISTDIKKTRFGHKCFLACGFLRLRTVYLGGSPSRALLRHSGVLSVSAVERG